MSSAANPNPWAPYDTYKDCSQGICSIYCPQWCYIIFPPPPPFSLGDDSGGTDFSPLIIAVIGILASAFILVSYYTIISKYCRRRSNDNNIDFNENRDEMNNNEAWQGTVSGLDETLIKSITVCKYKKGDGLVEGTDCSVCLSEFQEDESLRLLPKCNHAFHLPCIDTWLKSHSSCPLCRANIASINTTLPNNQVPAAPIQETTPHVNVSVHEYQHRNNIDAVLVIQDLENSVHEEAVVSLVGNDDDVPKTPIQGFSSSSSRGMENSDNIIEITQDGSIQPIRRSVSLNSSLCQEPVLIADILRSIDDDEEDFQVENIEKNSRGVLNLVRSPLAIKRSVSTGRFMFTRYGKGRNSVIPN